MNRTGLVYEIIQAGKTLQQLDSCHRAASLLNRAGFLNGTQEEAMHEEIDDTQTRTVERVRELFGRGL